MWESERGNETLASLPAPGGPITGSRGQWVVWHMHELCSQTDLDPNSASDTSYVALGKLLNLLEPHFLICKHGK